MIPRCPESSPLWTPSHISSRISHLTTRPSFEPWSNFFSSVYDRVKGCDCETIASALAKIGSARVLCMELHQEQGNLRGLHIEWFSNSPMSEVSGEEWSCRVSHRWACLIMSPQSTLFITGKSTTRSVVDIADIVILWFSVGFWRVQNILKINKNINLPCPSQRDPPSLQRVPRWQW